jgi:hypothetical protein
MTTNEYLRGVKTSGWAPFQSRLWQRNYYEHVIRDEASLDRIREYILNNPAQWAIDRENPAASTVETPDIWRLQERPEGKGDRSLDSARDTELVEVPVAATTGVRNN